MADRRLQVFYTVGRMLSFTKAAETLKMTQPAVTFQIRQLEEQYNVRLFDRAHNKVNLTQAGQRVYDYAERIFGLYSEMESAIANVSKSVGGLLRVGATTSCGETDLPVFLAQFKSRFEGVHIELKIGSAEEIKYALDNNLLDVAVLEGDLGDNKYEVIPYHEQRYCLVVPFGHTLAGQASASVQQISQETLVLHSEDSTINKVVKQIFARENIPMPQGQDSMQLDSVLAIKNALVARAGVAILPKSCVGAEVAAGHLCLVPLEHPVSQVVKFVYKDLKFPLKVVTELLAFAKKSQQGLKPGAPVAEESWQTNRAPHS